MLKPSLQIIRSCMRQLRKLLDSKVVVRSLLSRSPLDLCTITRSPVSHLDFRPLVRIWIRNRWKSNVCRPEPGEQSSACQFWKMFDEELSNSPGSNLDDYHLDWKDVVFEPPVLEESCTNRCRSSVESRKTNSQGLEPSFDEEPCRETDGLFVEEGLRSEGCNSSLSWVSQPSPPCRACAPAMTRWRALSPGSELQIRPCLC